MGWVNRRQRKSEGRHRLTKTCSSILWTPNFEVPTRYFVGTFFLSRLGLRFLGVIHARAFVRYWQLQHGGLLAFFQKR
jgi:hypothetical protein